MTGNQVIKHWTLLLLSCCILLPSLLRAEEARGRESILIISSYNPDTRRMSSFITEFERQVDRKSTRLNSSHKVQSRMPSSA